MKVVVAGGRDVTDPKLVAEAIEASGFEVTELVSGGARGVDKLAEAWADARGIEVSVWEADWKAFGKAAGPMRNREMAEYGEALVLIPTGGPGSLSMLREWQKADPTRPTYIHPTPAGTKF